MPSKVLIGIPTYDGMKYCFNELVRSLIKIDFEEYDILFVDNSRSLDFYKEIKEFLDKIKLKGNIYTIYDEVKSEKELFRLISSRNKIMDYARANNYDHLLMLDSDVMPPQDILKKLIKWEKDIVSGFYLQAINKDGKLYCSSPVSLKIEKEELRILKSKGMISKELLESNEELCRSLTEQEARSDKIFEVTMCAGGCMLLSKKAIEKLEYGYLGYGFDDNYFMEKAREKGFKIYCYPKVFCQHLLSNYHREHGKEYANSECTSRKI